MAGFKKTLENMASNGWSSAMNTSNKTDRLKIETDFGICATSCHVGYSTTSVS